MSETHIQFSDGVLDTAMDAIVENSEISDHDLAEFVLATHHGVEVRDALGDALREAVIPLMR